MEDRVDTNNWTYPFSDVKIFEFGFFLWSLNSNIDSREIAVVTGFNGDLFLFTRVTRYFENWEVIDAKRFIDGSDDFKNFWV